MVKRWLTPVVWQTRISFRIFLKIQHAHGKKMIDPPKYDRPGYHLEFYFKYATCAWSKDDWPPWIWQTRISFRIFLKIQHVHGKKMIDPPKYDRPVSHLEFFKDSTCAWSKDDWPLQVWQTRISPRIFLKIQHVHGQKLIDPPGYDRPGYHLEFLLKIQHVHGQKMIDPPKYDRPGSHLEFFLKIQHAHGKKMIDPPKYDRPGYHLEYYFKVATCTWSKDDWPPRYDRPGSHLEFFRFNMHVVKS